MNRYQSTDHLAVQCFVELLQSHGITKVVISPGSRNAPFIIALNASSSIECLSITDERSAGYFALGMSQQLNKPVAIICTSGTAVLNYYPAVTEAFYQNIPLIVTSADRPENFIDQGEGQTIRQNYALKNHVIGNYNFPVLSNSENLPFYNRQINEALNLSIKYYKPVHLNFHLKEPLYRKKVYDFNISRFIRFLPNASVIGDNDLMKLVEKWNTSKKIMILGGFYQKQDELESFLSKISEFENVIVLTENITNVRNDHFISSIDRVLSTIEKDEDDKFKPDILITFGGILVSKMLKAFLRKHPPKEHWQLSNENYLIDTYNVLSIQIPQLPKQFFKQLIPHIKNHTSDYKNAWQNIKSVSYQRHCDFTNSCEWSDLKAFNSVLKAIPTKSDLQLGNSTVVRYTQLFNMRENVRYFSNRGTSGIEGSISTAAGAAYISNRLTTVIVGDLSFLYDTSAFWNNYLQRRLKIIVINNEGGGIFRFIDGPSESEYLETFFEAKHSFKFQKIAEQFNLKYYFAENENILENCLVDLYKNNETAILEIKTPREKNANVLKTYFKKLKG